MRTRFWLPWEEHGEGYSVIDNHGRACVAYLAERMARMTGQPIRLMEERIYRLVGWTCATKKEDE